MAQMVGKKSQVMDGPSMWDLMLALFDGDSNSRRNVRFVVVADESRPILEKAVLNVNIDSVERVRFSEATWNIVATSDRSIYKITYSTNSHLGRILEI